MNSTRVEDSAATPHYTWENTGKGGYHLNGTVASFFLQEAVFPLLNKLPKGSVVGDYGCGEGRLEKKAPSADKRPYIFRGFELNPAAVERFNVAFKHTQDRAEEADLTRLNGIGQERFQAGLFWRVLHSIPRDIHGLVLAQIAGTLKPGGSLHVAALSERDWKRVDLEGLSLYRPGEMNDCYPVMEAALKPQNISSWPLYFFRAGELARLGGKVGLEVVDEQPIQEESGFEILRKIRPPISYDYVRFVKL